METKKMLNGFKSDNSLVQADTGNPPVYPIYIEPEYLKSAEGAVIYLDKLFQRESGARRVYLGMLSLAISSRFSITQGEHVGKWMADNLSDLIRGRLAGKDDKTGLDERFGISLGNEAGPGGNPIYGEMKIIRQDYFFWNIARRKMDKFTKRENAKPIAEFLDYLERSDREQYERIKSTLTKGEDYESISKREFGDFMYPGQSLPKTKKLHVNKLARKYGQWKYRADAESDPNKHPEPVAVWMIVNRFLSEVTPGINPIVHKSPKS